MAQLVKGEGELPPVSDGVLNPEGAGPARSWVLRGALSAVRQLRANRRLSGGAAIGAVFVVLGFVLPLFVPGNPTTWNLLPTDLPPSTSHLLGTTDLGQDTFWFLVLAVHNSLIIGLLVAALSTAIGVVVGLVAGYGGGIIDRILMLVTDTFIVIPSLPILILMAAILKGRASLITIAFVITVFNWPWPARQARAMTMSLREREFVHTASFSGESTGRILLVEIFPYMRSWATANFVNAVLVAIGTEAGLAVIGLSDMQQATLGTMIYWAMHQQALLLHFWFWLGSPVLAIVVLFLGLFLLSTGFTERSALRRGYGRA